MRKKIFALALAVAVLLITPAAAASLTRTHQIDELYLTVNLPEDWYVLTPDEEPDAQSALFFALAQLDVDTLQSNLKSAGIHLDAISDDATTEVTIVYSGETEFEANKFSESDLLKFCEEAVSQVANTMAEQLEYGEYQAYTANSGQKYAVLDTKVKNGLRRVYGVQYFTMVNGQMVSVNLSNPLGDPLTQAQRDLSKEIVDQIKFEQVKSGVGASSSTFNGLASGALMGALEGAIIGAIVAAVLALKKRTWHCPNCGYTCKARKKPASCPQCQGAMEQQKNKK